MASVGYTKPRGQVHVGQVKEEALKRGADRNKEKETQRRLLESYNTVPQETEYMVMCLGNESV